MPGVQSHIPEFLCSDPQVQAALNEMARGVEMLMGKRSISRANVIQNGAGIFEVPAEDDNGVLFYNGDSSNSIPPYGIALTNGSQANGGACTIKTKQPDTYGCQTNWVINGPGSVSASSYGVGSIFGGGFDPDLPGLIVAYDNADGTPAKDELWGVKSGTYLVKKKYGGFRVIGVYDSTNYYALVVPAPTLAIKVKTVGAHNKGVSQACDIWTGVEGLETAIGAGTVQVTCYNRFANLASGKWARAEWNSDTGNFELAAGEC